MTKNNDIKKSSQRGSALVLTLSLAIIVAFTIAYLQNYINSSQNQINTSAFHREYTQLLKDIKATVGNESFCNQASTGIINGAIKLSDKNLRSLSTPTKLKLPLPNTNSSVFKPGWKNSTGNLRLHKLRLDYISHNSVDIFKRATSDVRSIKAEYNLVVEMQMCRNQACTEDSRFLTNARRSDGSLNPYAIDIPLMFHFEANTSGLKSGASVVSCFGKGSAADFCESVGAVWNPFSSSPKHKCEPFKMCYDRKDGGNTSKCSTSDPEVAKRFKRSLTGYVNKQPQYQCRWCNMSVPFIKPKAPPAPKPKPKPKPFPFFPSNPGGGR